MAGEPTRRKGNQPSSSNSREKESTTIADGKDDTIHAAVLMETEGSSGNTSTAQPRPILISGKEDIGSVTFLVDGKDIVSGGASKKIRRWRVEDGKEVGIPMDVGSNLYNVAVSRDGKWIVNGTSSGLVQVWNAENHSKLTEFKGHTDHVRIVDISPDGTRIATGSNDKTVCVWSFSTGRRLLGPFPHEHKVAVAKFSPDGRLIATAAWNRKSLRIYDSHDDGRLLAEFPEIAFYSAFNNCLAWTGDGSQLFALSGDGNIHRLDALSGTTLSKWSIHGNNASCVSLISNGRFIAAAAGRSVTFWDTITQTQVGSVIEDIDDIWSMAISSKYDLVTSTRKSISIRSLSDMHLSSSLKDIVRTPMT